MSGGGRRRGKKKNRATLLADTALEHAELFYAPDRRAYADVRARGRRATYPVDSAAFRHWLQLWFRADHDEVPSGQTLNDACRALEARAIADGQRLEVHIRVASLGERVFVDLGDETWEAIEITPESRPQFVTESPVRFRRASTTQALPRPVFGGSLEELRAFLNAADEDDFRLTVAWLVAAIRGRKPFPVALIQGEQGSAKTTRARVLRELVDPAIAPLRSFPDNDRDLAIAAENSWVLAFDNLSGLTGRGSDNVCRLATGSGFAARKLYSDREETVFEGARPVILNGITDLARRADLADRSILFDLPGIPEAHRKTEREFWTEFERARPRILGALYEALGSALMHEPCIRLNVHPRMADFAVLGTALERALRGMTESCG